MRCKTAAIVFFLSAVCLLCAGCIPKPGADTSDVAAAGKLDKGIYSNTYFNMTVSIPEGWNATENARMVQEATTHILAAPVDDQTRGQMQMSLENTVYLAYANKYPEGFIGTNPSITIAAEKMPYSANFLIGTGEDYLRSMQEHARGISKEMTFGAIDKETVGDRGFFSTEASIQKQGATQYRKYYAMLEKGYALIICTIWQTDAEKKELEQMVASITFPAEQA